MELTILTPTFNREHYLPALYESLQNQTNLEFEWLVIDDGSTDATEDLIQSYIIEGKIPIRYIKKENGGKHTALNVGIKKINSVLTIIVDSDDQLTHEAVDTILQYHKKYKSNIDLCGYSFLRVFLDGKTNGKPFPSDEWITSFIEARINRNDTNSDKAEVYYTDVLKQYPFPEYPGERFLGEDIVWIRIAKKYKMVHINKGIYIGQYLEEGLSRNRREHNIKSPIGCMNRAKEYISREIKMKYRLKGTVQYIVYGKIAGKKSRQLLAEAPDIILAGVAMIPSLCIYIKWKNEYLR